MIVDSCLDDNDKPAALEYLYSIGVDVSTDVRIIIISHFHNDHILGLPEIINKCSSAKVIISQALNTSEFHKYLSHISKYGSEETRMSELNKVMDCFKDLVAQRRFGKAQSDRQLYKSTTGINITALSPSDDDINESDTEFANLYKVSENTIGTPKAVSLINPNNYSIVLRVNKDGHKEEILLGADLEVRKKGGWESVCNCINKPGANVINIFKIPHHGSSNGYHARTWKELISAQPYCILTTFGPSSLPTEDMINHYKILSNNVFSTTTPNSLVTTPNLDKAKATLKSKKTKIYFKSNNKNFGAVHVGNGFSASPVFTLTGDAVKL